MRYLINGHEYEIYISISGGTVVKLWEGGHLLETWFFFKVSTAYEYILERETDFEII